MKIGDKLILNKIQFPASGRNVDLVDEFRVITISEVRKVRGHYTEMLNFKGYKAKDNDGNEWTLWWDIFPDDAACPSRRWWCEGLRMEMYDVEQINMFCQIDQKPAWLYSKIVNGVETNQYMDTIMDWCEKHKNLYYKTNRCLECEFKRPEVKPIRHIAIGW